ncbi:ATPase domain-containing protein [Stigmatella hybrida]|uniref:ATPase domain-containing protein n=1 Tax=Stigmatella hybrida TaxID=394097 RepID=UPI001CDABA15|nr:ATPase domain-containing protein [Stigmatella hybrida]
MTAVVAPSLQRIPSGVLGLDAILDGGFLQGGTYIIAGMPGTGKTILGNQVCFHHVAHGGRVVYVTLLAETHGRLLAHLRGMAFFSEEPLASALHYVSAYRVLTSEGLPGLLELLRKLIREHRASMLVLDGLVSASASAPNELAFKEFVHELNTLVSVIGCTTFLLTNGHSPEDVHPEHTMVDGLIELTDELIGVRAVRELIVRKFRGSAHLRGRHVFQISPQGITVYPRSEAMLADPIAVPGEYKARAPVGLPELDGMLRGGLQRGSATLIMGPSGSGKTLLGLQFLSHGANQGEPSLYFGFYESPPRLVGKGESIGLDMAGAMRGGMLEMLWQPPVELVLDALAVKILSAIRRRGVQRLLIDGLIGFKESTVHPERINRFFAAFTNELRALDVTTVFTEETRVLFGPEIETPVKGLSALVENHLFLRQVEWKGELRRVLAILKTRESGHDPSLREVIIDDQGWHIGARFKGKSVLTDSRLPRPPKRRSTDAAKPQVARKKPRRPE